MLMCPALVYKISGKIIGRDKPTTGSTVKNCVEENTRPVIENNCVKG